MYRSAIRSDILEEHLEEASFLYEQRMALRENPELSWIDIDDFEARFEAHVDGLVLGEDVALEMCKQAAAEGDHSELHVAIRVFCRRGLKDLVFETIDQLDLNDGERQKALADALHDDLPAGWRDKIIEMLGGDNSQLYPLAVGLIGYCRLPAGDTLLGLLDRLDGETLRRALWALGRIREHGARVPLFNTYLNHRDENVRAEAALTLLRLGEKQALQHCITRAGHETWPSIALGLGGVPEAFPKLYQMASSEQVDSNCLLALGLFGDSRAVDILLHRLGSGELVDSASLALFMLTGADLHEEVFVPEEIEEEDLFEEERERLEKGESLFPQGEEPGITFSRISQKREDWTGWWEENKSRFSAGIRYRCGKPCTPGGLLENLEDERSPGILRGFAHEELVIRYGKDFPFELEMTVAQQQKAMGEYRGWIASEAGRFQPGKWYFAGQI
jgi:uncharacterized protein (TIGR02270 family)